MKKTFAAILFLLYFTSSSGATFHLHYCMDELMDLSLNDHAHADELCVYCGMPKPGNDNATAAVSRDCCQDKKVEIKTDKDQRLTDLFHKRNSQFPGIAFFLCVKHTSAFLYKSSNVADDHAPPGIQKLPLFMRFRVFRI